MKFFNIINESKSFLLILLFTLAITTQSCSSPVVLPPEENLNELCKVDDLTTLNAANKEKCVGWCKIKTNWSEKCAKIGVKIENLGASGIDGATGESGESGVDNGVAGAADISLKTRIIKALKGLDDIATGLKVPDSYNDIYSFKIKLDKSQRSILFEHMKPKEPSTDADAIDKTVVSDTMKAIILDGLGYSDTNDDKLEKFFIDFRNKWLKFEAKGSTTDTNVAFEPSVFKGLQAALNHANQGPMHQIYNMLEADKKVFSNAKYNNVIASSEVATELKNLRDAIVTFIKDQLIVTCADKWPTERDLEFSIKLGKLNSSLEAFLDGLDAETFDATKKEDFDKIKDYFTPNTLTISTLMTNSVKRMASHGLLVLSGGDFKYDLNPEKVAAGVAGNKDFTQDEKTKLDYKIYAARLKIFEAGLKAKFATGVDYGTPVEGSLLHKITEFVRDPASPAAANSAFEVYVAGNFRALAPDRRAPLAPGDRVIHKVGFVGGKWVVLIYGANRDARKTLIQFITEASVPDNPPRFTVQAPSTYISADFWGTGPGVGGNRVDPTHHTFDALIGPGLAGTNLFALEKLLSNAIVRTAPNASLHNATASDVASPLKLIKFRLMNTHGLGNRNNDFLLFDYQFFLGLLKTFDTYFSQDNTFGRDTDKVFAELTALSPSLGQLYAFNQFIFTIDSGQVSLANDRLLDLPAAGADGNARHYISTHVVDPNTTPDDITLVLTSRLIRNR